MKSKDFTLNTDNSNVAEIILTERYPAKGFALNTVAEMTVYILEGEVILNKEGSEARLVKGNAVLVEVNKKYFWQPELQATLLIFSTPPWTLEQAQTILE